MLLLLAACTTGDVTPTDDSTGGSFVAAGYVGGTVTLSEGGTTEGDPVEGRLTGTVHVPGG